MRIRAKLIEWVELWIRTEKLEVQTYVSAKFHPQEKDMCIYVGCNFLSYNGVG